MKSHNPTLHAPGPKAWRRAPDRIWRKGRAHESCGRAVLLSFLCALLLGDAWAADPTAQNTPPFLRFRDRALTYSGPSSDLTNLAEIRIGWFGPYDPTNALGADMWWAANLAVREANDRGGLDALPFRLVPCWAADPWGSGVSKLTRMVYEDRPLALLGSVDSASTHLAEQVVAKANLPLVSPAVTDKSATLAGVPWMFSCAPADNAIARPLVAAMLAECTILSGRSVLLSATDHASRMTTRELLQEFSRQGRLPDFRFEIQPGATALDRTMAALAEANPAAILISAGAEDAARLVLAVRKILPEVPLFGTQAVGRTRFLRLAGAAAENIRFPLLFAPGGAEADAARFCRQFEADRGYPPDHAAALAYDATRLLLEAIRQAGPNRARIRAALGELTPWPGIAGSIHFDGTGQNTRSNICLGTIRQGTIVPLRS